MTTQFRRLLSAAGGLAALLAMGVMHDGVLAQNRQNRQSRQANNQPAPVAQRNSELRSIDVKAHKVQDTFIRDAVDLAQDYEKAGDLERSIQLLEAVLKINPDLEPVKKKIEYLKDNILSANDYTITIEADGSWGKPVGYVRKGKPFRIDVTGTYRFNASVIIGPDGFPEGDIQKQMLAGVRCGALAGLVLSKDKPGEPFEVGKERDITPEQSGLLYLKVNAPPGSNCSGKLKTRLSGYVLSPDLNNVGK